MLILKATIIAALAIIPVASVAGVTFGFKENVDGLIGCIPYVGIMYGLLFGIYLVIGLPIIAIIDVW